MTDKKEGALDWKKKLIAVIGGIAILIGIVIFGKWIYYRYTHAVTSNAFVRTDMVELSPLVLGHIKQLLVDDGDRVKKGQIVALIDERDYKARVALRQAEKEQIARQLDKARVSLTRSEKESLQIISIGRKRVIEAGEMLKKAKANLEREAKDYERYKNLVATSAISRSRFDAIAASHEAAQADFSAAETHVRIREDELSRAELTKLQVEEARKDISTLMASCETAEKGLQIVLLDIEHTLLKTPIDGVIAKKHFEEGDFISPGFPVFSLYGENNVYVEANLEETKTGGVKVGQWVDISVDAYPGNKLRGKVIKVGKAAGQEFALIPRDLSAGEFTKVVQRIPIKIQIPASKKFSLKPGMSVTVGIELD